MYMAVIREEFSKKKLSTKKTIAENWQKMNQFLTYCYESLYLKLICIKGPYFVLNLAENKAEKEPRLNDDDRPLQAKSSRKKIQTLFFPLFLFLVFLRKKYKRTIGFPKHLFLVWNLCFVPVLVLSYNGKSICPQWSEVLRKILKG